jgi:hypothetical protein
MLRVAKTVCILGKISDVLDVSEEPTVTVFRIISRSDRVLVQGADVAKKHPGSMFSINVYRERGKMVKIQEEKGQFISNSEGRPSTPSNQKSKHSAEEM